MLNGQLPLTDLSFRATRVARRPRAAWVAGLIGLALLAGCSTTKTRAPVVDLSNQPAAAQPGGTYVVKPGDTLYQIARANNVDIESVKRWNNISDPNQISVGQVLKLSGSASA
ncbi:MAG TPA: LysM domain-containing protein, partial [Bordetella sp.]|nr:LysM domain-containing protein [Bordetella sp.]